MLVVMKPIKPLDRIGLLDERSLNSLQNENTFGSFSRYIMKNVAYVTGFVAISAVT